MRKCLVGKWDSVEAVVVEKKCTVSAAVQSDYSHLGDELSVLNLSCTQYLH